MVVILDDAQSLSLVSARFIATRCCKRGLLSCGVRHVRVFCRNEYIYIFIHHNMIESTKYLQYFFHPGCSHAILVFPYQALREYSNGDPLTIGGVECRWKITIFVSLRRVLSSSSSSSFNSHLTFNAGDRQCNWPSCSVQPINAGQSSWVVSL